MSAQVHARFYVSALTRHPFGGWARGKVTLSPCLRGEENKTWATATPSGSIEMTLNDPGAWAFFENTLDTGADIAITFEAVAQVPPA